MRVSNEWELIKLNIKQLFSETKFRRGERKRYKLDKLMQRLPVKNSGYEDLAPESEIKNGEEYLKALYWGLKSKSVKNIALTGPYGSGKSSIIQTYLNRYPSTKALNISLAAFDLDKEGEDDFENKIELGILKQLFYKVDSNRIPQSRYRKIRKTYYFHYLLATLLATGLALLASAFFLPEKFDKILCRIEECGAYYHINSQFTALITVIFGFFGIIVITYALKWCSSRFKLVEVNIADKATVSNEGEDDSIFDKNMDEIIYFFEATNFDTVFIEDLDRFDSTEIFVKLRELNAILNNYDLIKRKITFVYAIRDDMFENEERTKFFDFIVPVIPIINSTNSGEILRGKLQIKKQSDGASRSSLYHISSSYITLVSPFIEDMRVLTSICNEFIVYKNTLNSLHLKDEEMFSIIIFKNLYPGDFAELELEKGIVKKAFVDKKNFVARKQSELQQQKNNYEKIFNGIEKDILKDIRELKAAFLDFLVDDGGPLNYCNINGNIYYYHNILQDDFDINIFQNATKVRIDGYKKDRIIDNLQIELQQSSRNYLQRISYMKNNKESRKEEMRKQIEKCDRMISELNAYTLKNLIEEFGSEDVFSDEVMSNRFLVFLLRKGFINENYADYINYFHPNSITKDEMNFIRGIRMQKAVGDFSYCIRNVAEVCGRIEFYEFKQPEALNFDLVDYLVTKEANDKKCKELFDGLSNGSQISNEFIKTYIDRGQNTAIFVNMLCKYYIDFWVNISNNNLLTIERKFFYLGLIIQYADISDVKKMNDSWQLDEDVAWTRPIEDFIVDDKMALVRLSGVDARRMIDIIDALEIQFTNIEIDGADREVVGHIFDNDNKIYNYQLNINMLRSIFKFKFPDKAEMLEIANYTTVLHTGYTPLLDYIYEEFENFKNYVSEIVIGQESNVNESIESVEDILERLYDKEPELCMRLLDKENVIWDNIENCCVCASDKKPERRVILDYALKNRRIKELWSNFLGYYQEYGLTSKLVEWLDNVIDSLMQEQRSEQLTDQMIKEILTTNISTDTFEKIIEEYTVGVFDCELIRFGGEKIALLIAQNYIPFTLEYLGEMQQTAPEHIVEYVTNCKEAFMQNIESISLEIGVISKLIQSSKFNGAEIKTLLNLFQPSDMDKEMALTIRNLQMELEKNYVEKAWNLLDVEDRYQLLLNQLNIYSLDEISMKLDSLASVYKALSDRSRRHREYLPVDRHGFNEKLLTNLEEKKYITSFEKEHYDEEDRNTHERRTMQHFVIWVKQKQQVK